jgi:hypothetical protein
VWDGSIAEWGFELDETSLGLGSMVNSGRGGEDDAGRLLERIITL